jgi:hypothetical protein
LVKSDYTVIKILFYFDQECSHKLLIKSVHTVITSLF